MPLIERDSSYYDEYERRSFFKLAMLERWTADCQKRRERYVGKTLKRFGEEYPIVDMVFTEPGLVGWLVYEDNGELRKMSEGSSFTVV